MRIINLLPKTQQKEITLDQAANQLLNFWLWVIGSMLLLFLLSLVTVFRLNTAITETETEISKNREALKSSQNQQLEKQVLNLNTEIQKIKTLRNEHYRWSNGLIELGNIIPAEMVVDVMSLQRETGKVDISGTSRSRGSVLQFWANMHKSSHFKDINFPLTNLERSTDAPYSFTFYINEEEIKKE
jgi:Tfp pilus assembly protein PilN